MKNYDEIARDVFAYRDEYVARQKRTRKTVMRITSVACAFAVVAAVGVGLWQGGDRDQIPVDPATPSQSETTKLTESTPPTTQPTDPDDGPGIGGDSDDDECKEHNFFYHHIGGNFTNEQWDTFLAVYSGEDINIVNFVRFHNITREEYIEAQGGMWTEENLDEIAWNHGNGCPYTKNQYLDAIYGDDPELTAWVFAPDSTWP